MQDANRVMLKAAIDSDPLLTKEQKRAALEAVESAISGNTAKEETAVIKWKEAAARLGITTCKARQLAHAGKLTPISFTGGRSYGVTKQSLEALISECSRKGGAYAMAN